MATFTWYGYMGAGPGWVDLSTNKVVFCSSLTDLDTAITVGEYNDGTHAGDGSPGTDQCGANHMNNVKYIDANNMSVNGGGNEAINDTNLGETECTLRINFSHGASVVLSNIRLYMFNGTTTTTYAPNLDAFAFVRGESDTAWTQINNGGAGTGGDNSGERYDIADRSTNTSHDFYVAISVSPETVGAKSTNDIGISLTYS